MTTPKPWLEAPEPEPPSPSPSWRSRARAALFGPRPQAAPATAAGGPRWIVVSALAALVIGVAAWMILGDLMTLAGLEAPGLRIGGALLCAVAGFFWALRRNPGSAARRAFLASATLSVSALLLSFAAPSGVRIGAWEIGWLPADPLILGALLVLNLLLFFAQRAAR